MMAVVAINHGSKPEAHEEPARMRVVACMRLRAIPVAREQNSILRFAGQNRARRASSKRPDRAKPKGNGQPTRRWRQSRERFD